MIITREQCRAARALLGLTQLEVAESAHVATTTIADFEQGARVPTYNNLQAIRAALEAAGVVFIDANGGGPGVQLRVAPKTDSVEEPAISPEQCRAARAVLDLTQTDLAKAAGLGRSTVADYERVDRMPSPASLSALRDALEAAGVAFIDPNGGGPGLRLRK